MNILIIDGQGGRMGRSLVEEIRKICPEAVITAVGTNSIATGNMMKANAADHLATGENAVITGHGKRCGFQHRVPDTDPHEPVRYLCSRHNQGLRGHSG